MKPPVHIDIEAIGCAKPAEVRQSVRSAAENKITSREKRLFQLRRNDSHALRELAASVRRHAIENLDHYLEKAERKLTENGVQVHWAEDAEEARTIFLEICERTRPTTITKGKSMVTEEIGLNHFLEDAGYSPLETDLGEFVIQIAGDVPSHIVTPIIHINGREVAKLFEKEGLGEPTEDPEELTMQARRYLRTHFSKVDLGITGANFVVAETGRFITVENEGNVRLSSNAPRVHVAITGIEKVIASEAHAAVLLKMLASSSTGQDLTVYTQFIAGPRRAEDLDGPEEVHLILLDNGRTNLLGGQYQDMLRCIRCGACLNVCPVYRTVTGHGYGSVYPGPMGAILSPLLGGEKGRAQYSYLPKASSLCGACEEVCPVGIPIPRMLLALRDEFYGTDVPSPGGAPPFGPWAALSKRPPLWKAAMASARTFGWGPAKLAHLTALKNWLGERELPEWPKKSFRQLWKERKGGSR
ncbi:iron-sulfur cluster-binding protein [bacterium]|nr:iron-sulfur cluster-binding protein [bacterium]